MNTKPIEDIALSIEVSAPRSRVWKDMTDTDRVPLWLGCMNYEKRVGHVFFMQQDPDKRAAGDIDGATHCEILGLKEPDRFVFSWYFPDMPKTYVTITLRDLDGARTAVKFVHSGWEAFSGPEIRSIRDALQGGWNSFVLPGLKKLCES